LIPLLLQTYSYQEADNIWQVLRVWLNAEPLPGLRFTAGSANAIMLVTALLFIFMVELLLTIGIQVWERRVLGRMQSRWGPQHYGDVSPRTFRRLLQPLAVLLGLPALLYALEYWSGREFWLGLAAVGLSPLFVTAAVVCILRGIYLAFKRPDTSGSARRVLFSLGSLLLLGSVVAHFVAPSLAQRLWPELVVAEFFVPQLRVPGLPYITVLCTALAFGIYLVHTLGWAWRQGLADAVKIFFKEDVVPQSADRFLFLFAPVMVYLPALLSWIVIPFGVMAIEGKLVYLIVQDLNVGLLLIIADFALFLVAIIMSGYGSNNKYALIGAMREAAMLLTYEVPMLMSVLCVALFAGSLNLTRIVEAQTTTWAILPLFPAFVIYLICGLAETNRPPFDLAEASNELLGGYLVEYSGIRFALFYVAEYANIFTASALMTVCFFGGWKGPMFLGLDGLWLSSLFWFLLKTYAIVFCFIWARATMPRIRVDQIMFFSWKFLLPASVIVLALTAMGVAYRHPWFLANRVPQIVPGLGDAPAITVYPLMTTAQAVAQMTSYEKVFFWLYNIGLCATIALVLWMAWRVLMVKKTYPVARREITWT
jgi:NADH-quinone oxidoreductase subunit H